MNQSAFVRNIMTLISGKMASQIISMALVPIIARLFNPDDFGIATLFITMANFLSIVVPLRYFRASLLTQDEDEVRMIQSLSAWILLAGCVVIALVAALVSSWFITMGPFLWLLPLCTFLYGMSQIMATEHTRRQSFRNVAVADLGQTLTMGSSRILLGLGGSSALGLILGYLLAGMARLSLLARSAFNPLSLYKLKIPWSKSKELLYEYRDFPLHSMPAGLVTFLAGKTPIIVMGALFAPAVVGLYAMADRLVGMPVQTASISIREVFIRKLTLNIDNQQGLQRNLFKLTLAMFLLGLIPFGILGFFGGEMLVFILGEKWIESGGYVQILTPWYFAMWVSTGVQPTFVVLRKQAVWLKLQIVVLLMRVAVFAVGYTTAESIKTILIWFSAINVFMLVVILLLIFYLVREHSKAH